MKKSIRITTALCLSLTAALTCPGLSAQERPLSDLERTLLEKIEALEKRVEELEKGQTAQPAAPPNAPVIKEAAQAAQEAPGETGTDANELRASWKDGLRLETDDGRFKLRVGGRIQMDAAWFDQDSRLQYTAGDEENGAEFRRARLLLQGSIYDNIFYQAEYDFAGDDSDPDFRDTYIGLRNIPVVGAIQLGHFREPMGLERLTSSTRATFMERALPNVFAPARNLGIMVSNHALNKRLAWAAGVFKDVDDFPSDDDSDEDGGASVTARLSGVPWYAREGRRLLHLGAAYSYREPDDASVRYRTSPESHLALRYLDTNGPNSYGLDTARVDQVDLWGLETALVCGPFSVQGEYLHSDVDTRLAGERDFYGYYIYASYFLTGEHRPYKLGNGVFGRVHPRRNFALQGPHGWGAWEIALRYSYLDLNSGPIRGGKEDNWTLGLNWYLNPNTRFTWNYVLADIDNPPYRGDLGVLQCRFEVDF